MIRSAEEVWRSQENKGGFEKACESVMRSIEKASAKGFRDCCFNPPAEFYEPVKAEFQKNGYTFRPTGYIGGVWQLTEQVCW